MPKVTFKTVCAYSSLDFTNWCRTASYERVNELFIFASEAELPDIIRQAYLKTSHDFYDIIVLAIQHDQLFLGAIMPGLFMPRQRAVPNSCDSCTRI
jgi:hypothetical protein